MPSLLAEDALHGTRKPCSRTLKALFLHQARPFDEKRGAWQLKYLDNPYWMFSVLLIQRVRSISHRKTQKNRIHRGQKNSGPSPVPSWPLPRLLPQREGEWSPRYPYGLDVGCFCLLIGIFIGSNALWYLYAEGLLWAWNVRQKAQWTLCALWEKKLPSKSQAFFLTWRVRSISHRKTQKNRIHRFPQRH